MEVVRRPIKILHQAPDSLKRQTVSKTEALMKPSMSKGDFSSHTFASNNDSNSTLISIANQGFSSLSSASNRSSSSTQDHSAAECLIELKEFFSSPSSPFSVSDAEIFRFACYHNFQNKEALKDVHQKHDSRHMNLRMSGFLLRQFQTGTLFPLPGLKTRNKKQDVFYMRPSRYVPSEMKTSTIIDNLCYVLNELSRTTSQCQNGVAFIANMNDWTMKNFSHDYCFQFMQALQGKMVPTKVELFLIVNPPRWFGKVWVIMKPMLSKSFAKKIHMIKEERLEEFLMNGYEQYIPDEFTAGLRITEEITDDFIDLRRYEETCN